MTDGFLAELSRELAYVASALRTNAGYAWWVVQCNGWEIKVACYLLWEAYDNSRLWWLYDRLRSDIRVFPAPDMRVLVGDAGWAELVLFLSVIDRAQWYNVPGHQHERAQERCSRENSSGSR